MHSQPNFKQQETAERNENHYFLSESVLLDIKKKSSDPDWEVKNYGDNFLEFDTCNFRDQ